jgi:hypothetical protein
MTATERQANEARNQYADELVAKGAHAIGVEPGDRHGHSGFVVVAYVNKSFKGRLPDNLNVAKSRPGKAVPLVVKKEDAFKPE